MARKRVYLAGPISGCNERQRREWRDEAKEKLGAGFEVIDPALDPVGPDEDPALVVERDRRAIATCDAVLANMWKESIGTSIGVFHAWSNAKVIVVVDPNHIGSQILRYYADDVTDTIGEAVKSLNRTLRAESALRVLKRNGKSEPLSRRKLANSIRRACWDAEVDDVVFAAQIRRRALERLVRRGAEMAGAIRTRTVEDTVFEVLQEMDVPAAVRAKWEGYLADRRDDGPAVEPVAGVRVYDTPQDLPVATHKAHSTIWDVNVRRLADVPGAAREALADLLRVEGLSRIRLTKFGRGPGARGVQLRLKASKSPGIVEGTLHDPAGVKGTAQQIQIVLAQRDRQAAIRAALDTVAQRWTARRR